MKNFLLLSLVLCIGLLGYSQNATSVSKDMLNIAVKTERNITMENLTNLVLPATNTNNVREWPPNEHQIGMSYYDLWSNTMIQDRFYRWDDGTMAGVWIYGEEATSFPDRGTGYNFYDGTEWGPIPDLRLEDLRCGWPNIAPWGDGEVTCAHNGVTSLEFMWRPSKGTGDWTQQNFLGPAGLENDLTWPRMTSSGPNNEYVHLIVHSYIEYAGQPGALLYSRTNDGGATWDPQNVILDGMGPDYYFEFQADAYGINARGDVVTILVGGAWNDLFYMRSDDNGDTWEKVIVWEHPYPFFDFNTTIADTMFACDNSAQITIDYDGIAHVVFGITRVRHPEVGGSYYYYPYIDGVGYWNDEMPEFSNDLNALAPPQYGYVSSEMVEDYNYIGWMQDVDGDGVVTLNTDILSYRSLGPSTFPTITVDEYGDRFALFASTTETYENGTVNYKHIWARAYANGEWGDFLDLSGDIIHIFDECIYPQLPIITDDNIHYFYMCDVTPGLALDDDHPYQENMFMYATLPKSDLIGIKEEVVLSKDNVSQNYPNPFDNTSIVNVTLEQPAELSLEVTNLVGQKVYEINLGKVSGGTHPITIDATTLENGVYFYTVRTGNNSVTKRMIVN